MQLIIINIQHQKLQYFVLNKKICFLELLLREGICAFM